MCQRGFLALALMAVLKLPLLRKRNEPFCDNCQAWVAISALAVDTHMGRRLLLKRVISPKSYPLVSDSIERFLHFLSSIYSAILVNVIDPILSSPRDRPGCNDINRS